MIFVSVAQAARRLGIDVKTLRRWLAEAQLPLPRHPHDGRKQGVSDEHLQALARLHQRSLTPLQEEPAASPSGEGCALPAALLALPTTLGTLQAQITTLQQQVETLTHLLQQHTQASAPPAASTKRPPKPASCAPHARPTASVSVKTPAKPVHVIPRVEYVSEGHYVVICPKKGVLPFEPETPEWFAWVKKQDAFRFVGKEGHFSAHHEWRVPGGAWRAHRHIRNHVYIQRLAPNHELTIAVLEQAAQALQTHLT